MWNGILNKHMGVIVKCPPPYVCSYTHFSFFSHSICYNSTFVLQGGRRSFPYLLLYHQLIPKIQTPVQNATLMSLVHGNVT